MPDQEYPVEEMLPEECWGHLEGEEFGRIAYRLVDEVHIVPINYAVDGRALLFRTAAGNKLLAAALSSEWLSRSTGATRSPHGRSRYGGTSAGWRRTSSTGWTVWRSTRGSPPVVTRSLS